MPPIRAAGSRGLKVVQKASPQGLPASAAPQPLVPVPLRVARTNVVGFVAVVVGLDQSDQLATQEQIVAGLIFQDVEQLPSKFAVDADQLVEILNTDSQAAAWTECGLVTQAVIQRVEIACPRSVTELVMPAQTLGKLHKKAFDALKMDRNDGIAQLA